MLGAAIMKWSLDPGHRGVRGAKQFQSEANCANLLTMMKQYKAKQVLLVPSMITLNPEQKSLQVRILF